MVRRTTFLPRPKDEKGNSSTTSHYPTWEAALHRSRHALETQLSKSHPELIFIPTILCIKISLQALPVCKTHYTYYHYPIEDLCLLALQPSPLHSMTPYSLEGMPCGRLNDWPQLPTPPYIHALCHVTLLFLLLEARNNSQPNSCWSWPYDLLSQMNVGESGSILVWA